MYFDGKRTNDDEVQMNETIIRKPTAIGYLRVSTALQEAEGYSLEAQQKMIEDYCAKAGYELLDTYSEQASGKNNNRKVVNEVIKRCRSTKSKLVIARLDRFTRDLHFLTSIQKQKGFEFIALDNPNADAMVIQIMMSVAENESRMISTRTITALRIAKENGVELGNHRSILATYSRLEKNKKYALTRDNDNLWDTFCYYRMRWNEYVVNHKNYKTFRKYIDPVYETVDTGLGWEEYIKRPKYYWEGEEYLGDEMSFWELYQKELQPEQLIGDRYKSKVFNMSAFGDLCEDAFLFQPLSFYGNSQTNDDFRISNSVAFQLPQLDMVKSRKKLNLEGKHIREYVRRFIHKAEIQIGKADVRAYDIGRLWTQLMRDNTQPATLKRVEDAREEAKEIYLPVIEEARKKGISGIRPLGRYLTEQGIITPKGGSTWGVSSVQSLLRLEEAIKNEDNWEGDDQDLTNDLAMALTFNDYVRGYAGYDMEVPTRDPKTGHITRPIDLTKLDKTIELLEEAIDNSMWNSDEYIGVFDKIDLQKFYDLRKQAIDKEPLFDRPSPRA